ncbi:hypothetical protein C882_3086 [Caenispirillum salinarum AK4]|uniref:Uncharacterized protein n=1 Tax=Caenispirillum salinarum AK4 TaxID=1238182 RepID=K9H367_9PROT|nr:hypothetical protein [Caenispirillum salinarum]EKV32022.1 hypothetical protein C882_3086 [Caenispirillum salinarum AK4]
MPLRHMVSVSASAALLLLAGCAWQQEGTGVVTSDAGAPAGRATLFMEEKAGWPTPLATVTLPDGETFTGKVIPERTEPTTGFAVGTGWGTHSRVGVGSTVILSGPERTSRASALLLSEAGKSMTCDIRTVTPGALRSGGFARCDISDGRSVALEF